MNLAAMLIYHKAYDAWGMDAQQWAFAEEVGEALTSLSHYRRERCTREEVLDEMVDTIIMAEQMALMYGNIFEYRAARERKLARLAKKLE